MEKSGLNVVGDDKKLPLPHELVVEILSWLPAEYLWPLRCVNKTWFDSLTIDSHFAKLQFDRSIQLKRNPSFIFQNKSERDPHFYLATDPTNCGKAIRLQFPSHQIPYASIVKGFCNGLVCFSLYFLDTKDFKLYIWNPITNDHITIPYSPVEYSTLIFASYPLTNEYKLVEVVSQYRYTRKEYFSQVSVYTIGGSSWRKISDDIPGRMINYNRPCPTVNGAIHWLGGGGGAESCIVSNIVALDLKDEVFKMVGLPNDAEFDDRNERGSFVPILMELGGFLCLLAERPNRDVLIWAMKEYSLVSSWIQYFRFTRNEMGCLSASDIDPFGVVAQNKDCILVKSSIGHILYDRKTTSFKNLNKFRFHSDGYTFIGSIISPRVISRAPLMVT